MSSRIIRQKMNSVSGLLIAGALVAAPATAQVYLVEDINPGPGGSYEFRAGALGYAVYFNAYDGEHGEELWVSNGTAEGTYLVADIWPQENEDSSGAYSSNSQQFLAGPGGMYFVAAHREEPLNPPIHDLNLWVSNGLQGEGGSTSIVSGFELALVNSLENAMVMNGDLYISGWDETDGVELWKISDGSSLRITDIEPHDGGSFPSELAVIGDLLFFCAVNSATYGGELWVTDGSVGGEWVIDIVPGTTGSGPSEITSFGDQAFFRASTPEDGSGLWSSDGTEGGTGLVADINPDPLDAGTPFQLVPVGAQLFFTADDGAHGRELWVTNGTEAGTHLVKDAVADGSLLIWEAVAYDELLLFVAHHPDSGTELWVSDGTVEGTHLVTDIYPGTYTVDEDTFPNSSEPTELTVAGNYLFFNADDGVHGPSLWVSDGTAAGTFMVANLFDYWSEEGPTGLTATSDRLFFQTESDLGREVHAIRTPNVVKPPAAPTGTASGSTETTYTFSTTGGSLSLAGGDVQYRFNWGDGESTEWLDVGVTSADHLWAEAGTYEMTVDARSVATPSVTSNSSDVLSVQMSFTETVEVSIASGPETGEIWVEYEFDVVGESDYGHDLEYRVDWGDEQSTDWAPFNADTGETIAHDWDDLGAWPVTVTLRCAEHTDVTDSAEHWITIEEETLATPEIDGPTTGWTDQEYDFTVGGGSSAGHDLEFIVFWGDGSDTGWQPFGAGQTSAQVSHTWTVAEPFAVEVGVRCAAHDYLETWNDSHSIEISAVPEEELSGPDLQHVGGDWNGYPDVSFSFTLAASSNLEHNLEYQVDWGDGTGTTWTAFGEGVTSVQLSHSWEAATTYEMFVEARCIEHTDEYASGTWQMFVNPEIVSEISLSGPSSGAAGVPSDYVLTGRSASGHAMQYYMDWGHSGAQTGWLDINPETGTVDLSHAWPADATYHLQYGVRCKNHPDDVQQWSETWVTILGETITSHTLDGPSEGLVGVGLEFTVTGTSSEGHALEYRFDWGDGFPTDWAPLSTGTASQTYHWAYPDEFTVTASVRCATHNHVLSEQQQIVNVSSDTPAGWVFGDDFETGELEAWSGSAGTDQ